MTSYERVRNHLRLADEGVETFKGTDGIGTGDKIRLHVYLLMAQAVCCALLAIADAIREAREA